MGSGKRKHRRDGTKCPFLLQAPRTIGFFSRHSRGSRRGLPLEPCAELWSEWGVLPPAGFAASRELWGWGGAEGLGFCVTELGSLDDADK